MKGGWVDVLAGKIGEKTDQLRSNQDLQYQIVFTELYIFHIYVDISN